MLLKERHFGRKLIISLLCMTAVLLLYYGVLNIVFGPVTHRSTAFCQCDRRWDWRICVHLCSDSSPSVYSKRVAHVAIW